MPIMIQREKIWAVGIKIFLLNNMSYAVNKGKL